MIFGNATFPGRNAGCFREQGTGWPFFRAGAKNAWFA